MLGASNSNVRTPLRNASFSNRLGLDCNHSEKSRLKKSIELYQLKVTQNATCLI